jgi:hypothetical protein
MLLLHLIISNHSFQYVDRPPVFSLLFIESSESSEILRLPPNVTSTSSRSTIISDICHSQLQFKLLRLITPHSSLPIQKLTRKLYHCPLSCCCFYLLTHSDGCFWQYSVHHSCIEHFNCMSKRRMMTSHQRSRIISNGFDLTIISSSWKCVTLTKANDPVVPQRLQPPLSVLVHILSYLEHEIESRDAICGVNKQWLMASQSVPNTMVRSMQPTDDLNFMWSRREKPPAVSSFQLAHRKYPRVTSFIDFLATDLKSLLEMTSFNFSSLRLLSIDFISDEIDTIKQLIRRSSSSSFELSLYPFTWDDKQQCYQAAQSLLDSFDNLSSSNIKASSSSTTPPQPPQPPRIRLNGRLTSM